MQRVERPLSPHLQIYRWRITMWLSSLHRISGLLLTLGAFVFAIWLISLASGPDAYGSAQAFFGSGFFKLLAALWALAFFYHMLNGVRHLLWDVGYGFERPQIRKTGWTVIVLALLASVLFISLAIF